MPNMPSRGGSRFSNRSDARTDKYSYFNDNAAKTCDDTTMIKHEPETKPCRGFFPGSTLCRTSTRPCLGPTAVKLGLEAGITGT